MDEELVQNGVMDGQFVMDAKIDPKVVICPYSKLVGGTFCNPLIRICWRKLLIRMNRGF